LLAAGGFVAVSSSIVNAGSIGGYVQLYKAEFAVEMTSIKFNML
jgi:hypothetical protein